MAPSPIACPRFEWPAILASQLSKSSWFPVSTEDKMIPLDAQRAVSKCAGAKVVETKGGHSVYVSQPEAVASLIEQAAIGAGHHHR